MKKKMSQRLSKLRFLAGGLCAFFSPPGKSSLSLHNSGLEIYDQPPFSLSLTSCPHPKPSLPVRKRPPLSVSTRKVRKITKHTVKSGTQLRTERKPTKKHCRTASLGGGRETTSAAKTQRKSIDFSAKNNLHRVQTESGNLKTPSLNRNRNRSFDSAAKMLESARPAMLDLKKAVKDLCLARKRSAKLKLLPHNSSDVDLRRRSLGGSNSESGKKARSYNTPTISGKNKSMQKSPYLSMWNIKVLEDFYDIKLEDNGVTGNPGFKIRRISNCWKTTAKSRRDTAETTQNVRRACVSKKKAEQWMKKYSSIQYEKSERNDSDVNMFRTHDCYEKVEENGPRSMMILQNVYEVEDEDSFSHF